MDLILGEASISSTALKSQGEFKALVTSDKKPDWASIEIPEILPAGSKAQLRLNFEGKLAMNMCGYYRSSLGNSGNSEFYALTQFEVCSRLVVACIGDLMKLESPPMHVKHFPVGMNRY